MTPFYRRRKAEPYQISCIEGLSTSKLKSQNDNVLSHRSIGGRESNCTRLKPSATNTGFCYSQLLTCNSPSKN